MSKMTQRKALRNNKGEVDFNVLRTFDVSEWKDWINARMSGRDPYGFAVGGTHARAEPSEVFVQVRDRIYSNESFTKAENAIVELLEHDKYFKIYSGYEQAEIFSIAQNVTRPQKGYDSITKKLAELLREKKYEQTNDIFRSSFLQESLGLLSHMQKFQDKQFRDIYSDFLRKRKEISSEDYRIYLSSFLGLQISTDYFKVDEEAIHKILDLNRGVNSERRLEIVFNSLGDVLKRKQDCYFNELRERELKRKHDGVNLK
jgi:hypothetical protein